MTPENCPNCGMEVPQGAQACPECGSCEETGWSDDNAFDGVDIPDDEFDYDDFIHREFGDGKPVKPREIHWFWWGVAVLLLIALLNMFAF